MSTSNIPKDILEKNIPLRTIKSFVKRSGRVTRSQQKALDEYSSIYLLDINNSWDFQKIFGNNNKVVLEIGFGDGDNVCSMAEKYRDVNFIGVEVHEAGVGRALNLAHTKDLTNIRFCNKDIVDILDNCIVNNSLDKVQIFFPDPWHKSAHHKRRLIQVKFVNLLISKLTKSGLIHIATDWENYYEHIEEVFTSLDNKFTKQYIKNQRIFPENIYLDNIILNRFETRFERRGIKLGHNIHDLVYADLK